MSGRRLGPEPPPKLWRHGHGHDGSAMPKRIHVDCNSDHRMRNGDRSAILDRHSEDLVAQEAGHGDASVRDPYMTQSGDGRAALCSAFPTTPNGAATMANSFDLTGQIALVTGAGRGLGRAIAIALALAGADVALGLRDGQIDDELFALIENAGRRVLPLQMDVTDLEQSETAIRAAAETFGGLDILVNNAGGGIAARIAVSDCSRSVTSIWSGSTRRPAFSISANSSSSICPSRSPSATSAPASASAIAIARPSPRPAPVTSTI